MAPSSDTGLLLTKLLVFGTILSPALAGLLPKQGRDFSLFTVVNFPNEQCTTKSDSTMKGVCFSSSECKDKGGTADGNCAAGFGVCCSFLLKDCGGDISQNCTYFQNPGYTGSYSISAATTCTYKVTSDAEICQLRLDFDNFVIAAPTTGDCATDTFVATGPTGRNPPTICGTNTGQHMYVETGMSTTATTLVFTMNGATAATRTYKVKVNFIPCNSKYRAPTDCAKYFTGTSGVITSYNFDGGNMLQGQVYSTCIRQEQGMCSIQYTATSITSPMPFALDALDGTTAAAASAATDCDLSYIIIPVIADTGASGTLTSPPKFCGGSLNTGGNTIAANAAAAPGAVISDMIPFQFTTFGDDANMATSLTGYSLMYTQIPC